jgi:hypothetical protein
MIGVIADPVDHDVVDELFELFKTPWELYRRGRRYDVLLCGAGVDPGGAEGRLTLVYGAGRAAADAAAGVAIASYRPDGVLSYGEHRLAIYEGCATFDHPGIGLATEGRPPQAAAYRASVGGQTLVRVGYDLFREVRALLTKGQPVRHAELPTLDLHISLLRDLITGAGIPLVEIPPVPVGHPLIACLTHDVDHASLRRHRWDHTAFGFLYRACVGSVINLCRGRASLRDLATNWAAAARLPLVHLGLAADFWRALHRYREIDPPGSSTFFVIPFKDQPGRTVEGSAPPFRAARYGAADIAGELQGLASAGCEVGVHGLDAWLDSAKGYEELAEVARITGAAETGVRMHWLYGGEKSAATLDKAGFAYDSTVGYNETVGYRAGTTQVFKPLDTVRLLELPMHIMDTALFYPRHLDLSPREARHRMSRIVADAARLGGAVTINWHDRSIAPERLWREPYAGLVEHLTRQGAWFATGSRAVAWFRRRRSARFESVAWEPGVVRARVSFDPAGSLPGLQLRVHPAGVQAHIDAPLEDRTDTCVIL